MKCPICSGELLEIERESFITVMDGNSCYHCTKDRTHKFWSHPFNWKALHYNPTVSETDWIWERQWQIINEETSEYKETTKEALEEKNKEKREREEFLATVEGLKQTEAQKKFRVFPPLYKNDIVDVQPVNSMIGLAFVLKHSYKGKKK